jgi:hypothetical protein
MSLEQLLLLLGKRHKLPGIRLEPSIVHVVLCEVSGGFDGRVRELLTAADDGFGVRREITVVGYSNVVHEALEVIEKGLAAMRAGHAKTRSSDKANGSSPRK